MPIRIDHLTPDEAIASLRSHNVLLAGGAVVAGTGKAVIFAPGMHTEFGKIARLTQAGRETRSPLQQEITNVSHVVCASCRGLMQMRRRTMRRCSRPLCCATA